MKNANHVKFMQKCLLYTKKHVSVQKMLTNGLNMGLPLRARVKKTVHGVETHWLSGKEKVLGAAVSKESHAGTVFYDMKCLSIDFLEEGATVNSASYCQLLR